MVIVAATRNKHKIVELEAILAPLGMKVITQEEAGLGGVDVEEDGTSFEENSMKKARTILSLCGQACIADDSGLEVDAIGGAPGVYSARFAGVPGDGADAANNSKLLGLLEGVPDSERTARFVSVITLALPGGNIFSARGECEGLIGRVGAGDNGFGYDPLFTPLGYEETFAQLPAETKNRISHRAKALAGLKQALAAGWPDA
ncbi:MAG: RdgB/HAM1 family non-canonical purine NTP pyrophosphatase [Clostridiales Family XIII bacterium]|jgi:XTP/dITP diphosphohydrolase|nr:RdgB/HAM1 family non-canonical purine NTP pyrophosphatase [Clostridiales Family XIII bacterium]